MLGLKRRERTFSGHVFSNLLRLFKISNRSDIPLLLGGLLRKDLLPQREVTTDILFMLRGELVEIAGDLVGVITKGSVLGGDASKETNS